MAKEQDQYKLVTEFHKKFRIPQLKANPRLQAARIKHLTEELCEYMTAVTRGDREGQLDALVDLVYVALGTAYVEGFDFRGAFEHVHECNMKKEQRATSRSEWDVVKPEGWEPPRLGGFIE